MNTRTFLPLLGLLTVLALPGCTSESGEDPETTSDALSVSVPNPSGAYFASVSAAGTGCKPGTWDATISPNGKELEISFAGYRTEIEQGQAFAITDCSLSIDLRTPNGVSFAVRQFEYEGHADLDRHVTAGLTAHYSFQGNPGAGTPIRKDLYGPFDDDITLSGDIAESDLVWSPCGTSRRLNASSRVSVRNAPGRVGSGRVTLSQNKLKTRIHLAWRRC